MEPAHVAPSLKCTTIFERQQGVQAGAVQVLPHRSSSAVHSSCPSCSNMHHSLQLASATWHAAPDICSAAVKRKEPGSATEPHSTPGKHSDMSCPSCSRRQGWLLAGLSHAGTSKQITGARLVSSARVAAGTCQPSACLSRAKLFWSGACWFFSAACSLTCATQRLIPRLVYRVSPCSCWLPQ